MNSQDIQAFFDQWEIYRRVIEHNYMFHHEIHAQLRDRAGRSSSLRVLDIGCGDASVISKTLSGLDVSSYCGVDLSPVALEHAERHLGRAAIPAELVVGNFAEYLEDAPSGAFNLVIAGFTLHHLTGAGRERCFAQLRRVLAADGELLLYDVFMDQSESRGDYLRRNHDWRISSWSSLTSAELASIWAHVSSSDFPMSEEELISTSSRVGFGAGPARLYTSPVDIHRLYAIRVN